MKVSDLFVKCLENEGVEYVFGVPGEENEDMLFSLENSNIRVEIPVDARVNNQLVEELNQYWEKHHDT